MKKSLERKGTRFQKGDKVLCIESCHFLPEVMTKGIVYTILSEDDYTIMVKENIYNWDKNRFIALTDLIKELA